MAKRGVGTIPLGETEGVHVLAVSLPQPGVVLAQMNVEHKGSEITFAPTWLHQMDLRGVGGSSDAMFDRRAPLGGLRETDFGGWVTFNFGFRSQSDRAAPYST